MSSSRGLLFALLASLLGVLAMQTLLGSLSAQPSSSSSSQPPASCLFASPMVFQDMHDGDRKMVSLEGPVLVIQPYENGQTWEVRSQLDAEHCNATIDFRVPGKPSPPPSSLSGTIYVSRRVRGEGKGKNLVEFTDPTGKLAAPTMPLNTWVQITTL